MLALVLASLVLGGCGTRTTLAEAGTFTGGEVILPVPSAAARDSGELHVLIEGAAAAACDGGAWVALTVSYRTVQGDRALEPYLTSEGRGACTREWRTGRNVSVDGRPRAIVLRGPSPIGYRRVLIQWGGYRKAFL
jgi:hypothetical protein